MIRHEFGIKLGLLVALVTAATIVSDSYAGKPGGGGTGGCPRNIECLDVWNPVICDGGIVYSNDCYAYRACATGCVPYGDDASVGGGSGGGKCPRNIQCTDIYNPVICSNGVIYGNSCYAFQQCATGCSAL